MAWDRVERVEGVATKSQSKEPKYIDEYYCDSADDVFELPRYPEIRVGSKAVIVNETGMSVCILMRDGWKGPF